MTHHLQFVKGYRENEQLRASFNKLAKRVFGINFESWYGKGYWTDKYVPFSYVDGGTVVANVSVNLIQLVIKGEVNRALQIGTVMTDPDYRNLGLSRSLMGAVIEEYEGKYDVMYLFANQSVLNFYPKFGFKEVKETQYTLDYQAQPSKLAKIRKLNGLEDSEFIYEFSQARKAISQTFGTVDTQELLMFYCVYVFTTDVYYLEDLDVIVMYQQHDEELHLFDVISKTDVELEEVLSRIATQATRKVVFHFTPDWGNAAAMMTSTAESNDVLFVRVVDGVELPKHFKHPVTAQA